MEIEYIKANGVYYYPAPRKHNGRKGMMGIVYDDVCFIKKLWFGRYEIRYYSIIHRENNTGVFFTTSLPENQFPNTKLIVYPAGIEEIRYKP